MVVNRIFSANCYENLISHRVNAIISMPTGGAANLCFGGKDFDTMYVACFGKVFKRKFNTRGVNTFENPFKPMPSGL